MATPKEQLGEVLTLLLQDPTNADLLSLRDDLAALAQMTAELEATAGGTSALEAASREVPLTNQAAAAADDAAAAASAAAAAAAAAAVVEETVADNAIADAASADDDAAAAAAAAHGGWRAGARCEALWEDLKRYHARVENCDDVTVGIDGLEGTITVRYLEHDQVATVPVASVNVFTPPDASLLAPGVPIKAVWPGDKLMYGGFINAEGAVEGTWKVIFHRVAATATTAGEAVDSAMTAKKGRFNHALLCQSLPAFPLPTKHSLFTPSFLALSSRATRVRHRRRGPGY
jgi:hypothetical protein